MEVLVWAYGDLRGMCGMRHDGWMDEWVSMHGGIFGDTWFSRARRNGDLRAILGLSTQANEVFCHGPQ